MGSQPNNSNVFVWAESALATIPPRTAVVVIMRHGKKEPVSSTSHTNCILGEYDNTRMLTDQGKINSEMMGRLLMRNITRIEHSCIPRCRETAQHMAYGAKFNGETTENPELSGSSFRQNHDAVKSGKENAKLIDRLAKDGCYPGYNPVLPFMAGLACNLLSAAKPNLNVSISHDWILYLMLAAAGIKIESFAKERISYLEPLFLWQENQRLLFHYRNMLYESSNDFYEIAGERLI